MKFSTASGEYRINLRLKTIAGSSPRRVRRWTECVHTFNFAATSRLVKRTGGGGGGGLASLGGASMHLNSSRERGVDGWLLLADSLLLSAFGLMDFLRLFIISMNKYPQLFGQCVTRFVRLNGATTADYPT